MHYWMYCRVLERYNNWSKNCHDAGHMLGWGVGGILEICGRFSGLASLCWVLNGCLICLTMFIYKSQTQVSGLCLSQHASPDVEKMILGNKCDANDKRQVSREQGEKVSAVAVMYFDLVFSESKNWWMSAHCHGTTVVFLSGMTEHSPGCHGSVFPQWDQKQNLC